MTSFENAVQEFDFTGKSTTGKNRKRRERQKKMKLQLLRKNFSKFKDNILHSAIDKKQEDLFMNMLINDDDTLYETLSPLPQCDFTFEENMIHDWEVIYASDASDFETKHTFWRIFALVH